MPSSLQLFFLPFCSYFHWPDSNKSVRSYHKNSRGSRNRTRKLSAVGIMCLPLNLNLVPTSNVLHNSVMLVNRPPYLKNSHHFCSKTWSPQRKHFFIVVHLKLVVQLRQRNSMSCWDPKKTENIDGKTNSCFFPALKIDRKDLLVFRALVEFLDWHCVQNKIV